MNIFGMVSTSSSVEYTVHAVRSFFQNTALAANDLFFLIDNDASFDPALLAALPDCRYLCNASPLSFAQNVNQMIERCRRQPADLYFLNNDVIFTPGWLEPLRVDRPSILSPLCNREVQYASSVVIAKTSHVANVFLLKVSMELSDYLGNEAALNAVAEAHRRTIGGYLKVYVHPFYCVKIPYPILEAVGRFDERFGAGGGEDFDYCLRTYLAGFSVEYALGSFNLHFGGKSSWSGAESGEEQQSRVERYHRTFLEKWGRQLYELILKEDIRILQEAESLKAQDAAGDLRSAIVHMLEGRSIDIFLP
jgi:GT2 family glycosyltransferase